ncbi:hypothetical protein THASP1DRAFT_28384 [Thamnocephalis sphaerospora]|uniref:Cytochrome c oxidase assembly protein COX20, mitochondrial n=1 Tax=Thamnocephalis sphaerospora TaxID=78915 RepID=A0A4P9XUF4_9FUNG|nr:hypothetical protein THASP1DRAFT_28384 [Thamnocephalis sphaerospora]|eukprot:RKP09836.1 hypothetical protein THASP1DRAFT_28384 [Thamnocephalis sphaerospora]
MSTGSAPNPEAFRVIGDSVRCERAARKDGLIVAVCGLFISGYFAHRVLRLSRNASMLSALGAATVSGYMFSKTSYQQCAAAAARERREREALRNDASLATGELPLERVV